MTITKKIQLFMVGGMLLFSLSIAGQAHAQLAGDGTLGAMCGRTIPPDTVTDVACSTAQKLKCNALTKVCSKVADVWGKDRTAETLAAGAGLGTSDPRDIISAVINVLLGFLGIIAVVLILYGGFLWMTAAGNDDKVATAKNLMIAGVIGMVIVLAAFGISKFIVEALLGATGGI